MRTSLSILLLFIAAGCSRSPEPQNNLADVKTKGVLTLDHGDAVQIRQSQENPRTVVVANLDGQLQVIQHEGGDTPRSMHLISADKAEFSVTTASPRRLIVDHDGDGLPDVKVEGDKKYKRGEIEWIEIPPDAPGEP